MHLEKFHFGQIQNGRLLAIIYFYMLNRAKWLDHYYKTKCELSGDGAPWKFLTLSNRKWLTIGIIYFDRPDIR